MFIRNHLIDPVWLALNLREEAENEMATARWRFVIRESGPGWYYWELQDTAGQMVVLSRVARGKDGVLEDIELFRREAPIALLNAEVPELPSGTESPNTRPD